MPAAHRQFAATADRTFQDQAAATGHSKYQSRVSRIMKVEFQRLVPRCYFVVVTILFSGIPTATAQWYTQYQDLAAINARLDQFADDYPSLVESFVIGQSYEGRDIRGIKISGNGGDRTVRPGVLLNGTQHARVDLPDDQHVRRGTAAEWLWRG